MIEREGGARDDLVMARGNIFALYTGRNLFGFLNSFLIDNFSKSFCAFIELPESAHLSLNYTPNLHPAFRN